MPAIVHPSAVVSPSAVLEPGCFVMQRAVVNTHTRIERAGLINSGAVAVSYTHLDVYKRQHNIINLSETENLVTVMTCNEIFNPERPDTFFEIV